MRSYWPSGLLSFLESDPTKIFWAELYTLTLSPGQYRAVFDNFQIANGSVSSKWTATSGTFDVAQKAAYAATAVSGFAAMYWNNTSFLANQSAQAMIDVLPTGGNYIGVAVRMSTSAQTYYALFVGATGWILQKIIAGARTNLASGSHTAAVGDIIFLEAYGTLVTVKINAQTLAFVNDSAITSGIPGMVAINASSAAVTNWVGKSIGQRFWWTNWEEPVSIDGVTWQATGTSPNGVPLITRSKASFQKGTEVGEMELVFAADGTIQINGLPFLQACVQKVLDNATMELSLAASSYPPTVGWQGPGSYFYGRVSDITPSRTQCKITVKDKREELNMNLPRTVFQQGCRWTLFDSGCTLNRNSFAVNGTVAAGSNKSTINSNLTNPGPVNPPATASSLSQTGGNAIPAQTYYVRTTYITALGETSAGPESNFTTTINERLVVGSPPSATGALNWNCYVGLTSGEEQLQNTIPLTIGSSFTMPNYQQTPSQGAPVPTTNNTGYFDLGYLVWTSGANSGLIYAVKSYLGPASGTVNFYLPLPNAPSAGDTFTIYPGCDKQQATCTYKFNNLSNYGGTPYTPPPETTV